jgi:L-serine dehydratase
MVHARNGSDLIEICNSERISISEYAVRFEEEESGLSREQILDKMRKNLNVMREAAEHAMNKPVSSVSGIIGGDAHRLKNYLCSGKNLTGDTMVKAMARAISCSEVNASMGRIVAAPTAGSCGILPAVIITAGENLKKTEGEMIQALFAASAIGALIAQNATVSGAEGGCQAECGSAAAMAAGAVVEMMGGTPEMSLHAGAIVIQNILGLVCDPIAGLVEAPCAYRNASGAVSALTVADMIMAGVKSIVPFDEVVWAMYRVGRSMPCELRETAMGGIAITPTGIRLKQQVFGEK